MAGLTVIGPGISPPQSAGHREVLAIGVALGDGARPIGHARSGNTLGGVPLHLSQTFVNTPEKRLVFPDRSSESAAKVITLIWRASLAAGRLGGQALPIGSIKEIPGVQAR